MQGARHGVPIIPDDEMSNTKTQANHNKNRNNCLIVVDLSRYYAVPV